MLNLLILNSFGYYNNGSLSMDMTSPTKGQAGSFVIKVEWADQSLSTKVETTFNYDTNNSSFSIANLMIDWLNQNLAQACSENEREVINSMVSMLVHKMLAEG